MSQYQQPSTDEPFCGNDSISLEEQRAIQQALKASLGQQRVRTREAKSAVVAQSQAMAMRDLQESSTEEFLTDMIHDKVSEAEHSMRDVNHYASMHRKKPKRHARKRDSGLVDNGHDRSHNTSLGFSVACGGSKTMQSPSPQHSSLNQEGSPTKHSHNADEKAEVPRLAECPVFYPSRQQFENPILLMAALRSYGEQYGMVKIVPPPDFRPIFALDEMNVLVPTRVQPVHRLLHRTSDSSKFLNCLKLYLADNGRILNHLPKIGGVEVDLCVFSRLVADRGGMQAVVDSNLWEQLADLLHIPLGVAHRDSRLGEMYIKYLMAFDLLSLEERSALQRRVDEDSDWDASKAQFGFDIGRTFTMTNYRKQANNFFQSWFGVDFQNVSNERIEQEYWTIVQNGDRNVSVQYGSDVDTKQSGSGFPLSTDEWDTNVVASNAQFVSHPWNLNNLANSDESLLRFLSGGHVSGVNSPWMYVGMLFATFCWHVEDHYLSSTNYMHFGAGKRWYSVPGQFADAFDRAAQEIAPDLFADSPDLLQHLVTMFPPSQLVARGVPVYTTLQEPGDFIVTFPNAYHSGFSQGYNCCEAVNLAPPDWIPFGLAAVRQYRTIGRNCGFSHSALITRAAEKTVDAYTLRHIAVCLTDMIEEETFLRTRCTAFGVTRHEYLSDKVFEGLNTPAPSRVRVVKSRMGDRYVNANTSKIELESGSQFAQCAICKYLCYWSTVACDCSPHRAACIVHAFHTCGCEASHKTLYVRYTLAELEALKAKVEADARTSYVPSEIGPVVPFSQSWNLSPIRTVPLQTKEQIEDRAVTVDASKSSVTILSRSFLPLPPPSNRRNNINGEFLRQLYVVNYSVDPPFNKDTQERYFGIYIQPEDETVKFVLRATHPTDKLYFFDLISGDMIQLHGEESVYEYESSLIATAEFAGVFRFTVTDRDMTQEATFTIVAIVDDDDNLARNHIVRPKQKRGSTVYGFDNKAQGERLDNMHEITTVSMEVE